MHASHLPKENVAKRAEILLQIPFVFRWIVGVGDYSIQGPKDGYPVEQETLGEVVV
jgi:hypothetical protein